MSQIRHMKCSSMSMGQAFLLLLLSGFLGIFSNVSCASAADVLLEWNSPDQYSDGSPLLSPGGFKLYVGANSGDYSEIIDVGSLTSYKIAGLEDGQTYYFSVTAYDSYGNESDFSNELVRSITGSPTTGSPNLTISDALLSLRFAVGLLQPTEDDFVKLDLAPVVNGNPAPDGKIDITDTLTILRMISIS